MSKGPGLPPFLADPNKKTSTGEAELRSVEKKLPDRETNVLRLMGAQIPNERKEKSISDYVHELQNAEPSEALKETRKGEDLMTQMIRQLVGIK